MCALAYYNAGNVFLCHHQYHQALSYYNIVINKCQLFDETIYQNRAISKAFLNMNKEAIEDFCEAIKYNKYSSHIYMNRALILYNLKDFTNAENDLNTGNV